MNHKLKSKLPGEINNLIYADTTNLMANSKEALKSFWMSMKDECEKVGLKLNIQKTKIMPSLHGKQTGAPKSLQMVTAATKLKDACSLEEKLW